MDHTKMDKLSRAEFVKQECEDAVEHELLNFPVTIVPDGVSGLPEAAPPGHPRQEGPS